MLCHLLVISISPTHAFVNYSLISPQLLVSCHDWYIYHAPPLGLTVPLWISYLVLQSCFCTRVLSWGTNGSWNPAPALLTNGGPVSTASPSGGVNFNHLQIAPCSPAMAGNLAQQIEMLSFRCLISGLVMFTR